jgi:hypothetical protein
MVIEMLLNSLFKNKYVQMILHFQKKNVIIYIIEKKLN